jgi:hypothetical protein
MCTTLNSVADTSTSWDLLMHEILPGQVRHVVRQMELFPHRIDD